MGAFGGGSFNGYYTTRVCDVAFHLYHEHLLIDKYGVEILATVSLSKNQDRGDVYPLII